MQMDAMVKAGSTQTITMRKGEPLAKSRLRVMDMGPEADGDSYWIDFLGEAALSDEELRQVLRQPVVIEVRRMYPSAGKTGDGRAYLNANGGAVRLNGQVVQRGLRAQQQPGAHARAS